MGEAWIGVISTILGGIILYLANRRTQTTNAWNINAATIEKLSQQVDELVKDKDDLYEQVNYLKGELRRYVNAYSRAMIFVNKHISADVEIPDFLQTTDHKLKAAKPPGETK